MEKKKYGRPKKSIDTTRKCPYCGNEFALPEYNKKRFCSTQHARAYMGGKPRPIGHRITKVCPVGEHEFQVYPSHHYVTCCSREHFYEYRRMCAAQVVRGMSEPEISWFAGLFDGEGSIVMNRRTEDSDRALSFRIIIYNTVRPLLEQVSEFTGVGQIKERPKQKPHHTQCYYWVVGAGEALEILRQVRPWLIVKADRADAVLEGKSFDRQSRWDMIYPEGVD